MHIMRRRKIPSCENLYSFWGHSTQRCPKVDF